MTTTSRGRAQGVHHHRPDVGHRLPHGSGAGQARHGRPGRPRPGKARRGAEDDRAHGPAGGAGRVRPVGSRERAARGGGDHRAPSSARGPGQQRRHHADARHQERSGLGHDVRHEPPRPVRADRGARAASPRRRERRVRLLRRRRPRAQARRGRGVPWRPLHLRRGERARRVEARRLHPSRPRRLRDVEAVQPRDGDGVRARDPAAALQRRRTGLQPGHRPRRATRTSSLRFLGKYVLSAFAPVHQVLEHPGAGRQGRSPTPS